MKKKLTKKQLISKLECCMGDYEIAESRLIKVGQEIINRLPQEYCNLVASITSDGLTFLDENGGEVGASEYDPFKLVDLIDKQGEWWKEEGVK